MTFNVQLFISSLIYSVVGIVFFMLAFKIAQKLLPFDLVKELVDDDNVAVGILMASIIIGIAIIIASAIHG